MTLAVQKVTHEQPFPYYGPVGDGDSAKGSNVLRFFRQLKNGTGNVPCVSVKKVSGIWSSLPDYDRYTYHSFGNLIVQHYVTANTLKAWCHCGAWVSVTTQELDGGVESCIDCSTVLDVAVRIFEEMREDDESQEEQ